MASTASTPQDPAIAVLTALIAASPELQQALAQYATPVAVAEKVATPPTPREVAYAAARDKGYGFAKNGEVVVHADALTAAARVLRTGSLEIVTAPASDANTRRKITGTAVFRLDDRTVAFHEVFSLADAPASE
jgi:hypothetical protein